MTTQTAQLSSSSVTVWASNTPQAALPDAAAKLLKRWRDRATKCRWQAERAPRESRDQLIMEHRAKVWELAVHELEQELAAKPKGRRAP
jgi:uncharacterized protein YcbX